MGLLNFFSKPAPSLMRLPQGSFSVDREGCLLAGTISSEFPAQLLGQIAREVLASFEAAAQAQLPLQELTIKYPSLKITAREMRGGALIFLAPQTPYALTSST